MSAYYRPRRRAGTNFRIVNKKVVPSESNIQASICAYLSARGIEHSVTDASLVLTKSGFRRGKVKPGWPDVTGCLPDGRFLAIEVKSKYGKLRPMQEKVLDSLRRNGALVIVAYSLEDVKAVLEPRD